MTMAEGKRSIEPSYTAFGAQGSEVAGGLGHSPPSWWLDAEASVLEAK